MSTSPNELDDFEVITSEDVILDPKQIEKIRSWLAPTDYGAQSSEWKRHLESRAPGTGLWIQNSTQFQQWYRTDSHNSIWVKGVPGAGKSVLAASLIDNLNRAQNAPVLFFFFRYIVESNRTQRSLTRDWLAQLLPQNVRLQALLQPLAEHPLDECHDDQLWECLVTALASIPRAYCVIDALDEMDLQGASKFLANLNALAEVASVKLSMTSRPKQYLQSALRSKYIVSISLEKDLVGQDITEFVAYRLSRSTKEQNLSVETLATLVCARAKGLFLYARLLLDQLEPQLRSLPTDQNVTELVQNVPVGLEQMYDSILTEHLSKLEINVSVQVLLLAAVTHSAHPLRLNALASMLAHVFPRLQHKAKDVIRSGCGPLLEVLEDETVQVIHHSFTEFILGLERRDDHVDSWRKTPTLKFASSHRSLAIICLDYIQRNICDEHQPIALTSQKKFHTQVGYEEDIYNSCEHYPGNCTCEVSHGKVVYDYEAMKLDHPFLHYAATWWGYHSSKYDKAFRDPDEFTISLAQSTNIDLAQYPKIELMKRVWPGLDEIYNSLTSQSQQEDYSTFANLLNIFSQPNNPSFRVWVFLHWNHASRDIEARVPTLLHLTAFAGLSRLAKSVLNRVTVHDLEQHDAEERTPLWWAASCGEVALVSLLLEADANPDAEDRRGVKPLHEAVKKSHVSIIKMLLKAGVDPLTPKTKENTARLRGGDHSTKGETALEYVCKTGNSEVAAVLIPLLKEENLSELLCRCCLAGKDDIVKLLLESGRVSPDSQWEGATALYLAVVRPSFVSAQLLLDHGANVHTTSKWKPFSRRVGPRPNRQKEQTPLHRLVAQGWLEKKDVESRACLTLLIRAGADIEAQDGSQHTPLLSILYDLQDRSTLPVVAIKAMLHAGADISALDCKGDNILHQALKYTRNVEFVDLLLKSGADIKSTGANGATVLHAALASSGIAWTKPPNTLGEVLLFLIGAGARTMIQIKDSLGTSALETAARTMDCTVETFQLLTDACCDDSTRNRALWSISHRPPEQACKMIRLLMDRGVSLEQRNGHGQTPLLAKITDQQVFQALLDCGASMNAMDNEGKGVLHYKITNCNSAGDVQKLLGLGLDPRHIDRHGNTILHELAGAAQKPRLQEVLECVLAEGVSVNAQNTAGKTALHISVEPNRGPYLNIRSSTLPDSNFLASLQKIANDSDISPKSPSTERLGTSADSTEGLDLNIKDDEGLTPLHIATINSAVHAAQLLAFGADYTISTKKGESVLHLACRARQSNIVGMLLEHIDTNSDQSIHESKSVPAASYEPHLLLQVNDRGETALHVACRSGRPESVYLLLRSAWCRSRTNIAKFLAVKDKKGRTPLHACADFVHEQKIWDLLEHGELKHDRYRPATRTGGHGSWYSSEWKSSPGDLHDHETICIRPTVEMLINAGAVADECDSHGNTALDLAIQSGCVEMIKLLAPQPMMLQRTMKDGTNDLRMATLVALQERDAGLHLPEELFKELRQKPSRYLMNLSHDDLRKLAQQGADLVSSPPLIDDRSVLDLVAEYGFVEKMAGIMNLPQIKTRLESLSKNPQNVHQIKLLHYACERNLPNIQMVELLVDIFQVDVNIHKLEQESRSCSTRRPSSTALHVLAQAREWWQLDAIKLLTNRGAVIDARNHRGETPLHIACSVPRSRQHLLDQMHTYSFWQPLCVSLLLELGADPNAIDNAGVGALEKASSNPQITRILLQGGANAAAGGAQLLYSAIQASDPQIVQLILDAGGNDCVNDLVDEQIPHMAHTRLKKPILLHAVFRQAWTQAHQGSAGQIIELLIQRGADVHAQLDESTTLLHLLFERGEYCMISKVLQLSHLVDFHRRDQRGCTTLFAACHWEGILPGYGFHKEPKGISPIFTLIGLGADVYATDKNGRNLLHHILSNKVMEQDIILQLLQHEACQSLVHQRDNAGFSPLHCALSVFRPTACERLLAMGADLLEPAPDGKTALHHIAAQYLDVWKPRTYLHRQVEYDAEHYRQSRQLWNDFINLSNQKDEASGSWSTSVINQTDRGGDPPLFTYLRSHPDGEPVRAIEGRYESSSCSHINRFDELFTLSTSSPNLVDISIRNNAGESALHVIAARPKHESPSRGEGSIWGHDAALFAFFVSKGCDPLAEDEAGRTALDIASVKDKQDILHLFQYTSSTNEEKQEGKT